MNVLVVTGGAGTATIDGQARQLQPYDALLVEKGARCRIRAVRDGLRYLSIHRRRAALRIERHQPTLPAPQPQPSSDRPRTPR
jgi:mannose-6-phosphate isomerase-like protein (cupin superfamily)